MKRLWVYALLLVMQGAQADAVSDAYNDAAGYGRANSGQGTSGMNNTDPSSVIPGYTPNPSQSGYYGGVRGGDGGIAGQGQAAIGQNDAGQAIISAGSSNPPVKIDPTAPFITNGKNAESTSDTVVNGTYAQCTDKVVSKTTFENRTCDKDVAVTQTCSRDVGFINNTKTVQVQKTFTVSTFTISREGDHALITFPAPATGPIIASSLTLINDTPLHGFSWPYKFQLWGTEVNVPIHGNGTYNIAAAGTTLNEGGQVSVLLYVDSFKNFALDSVITNLQGKTGAKTTFNIQITMMSTDTEVSVGPDVPANCAVPTGGTLVSTQCTVAGGNRTTIVNGQPYTVYSDCWQYVDTYQVANDSVGTCAALMGNPSCTVTGATCSEMYGSSCSHQVVNYQCQETFTSTGKLCGGDYFCLTGDCSDTGGVGDSGFDVAVAKLAGLASAGEDVRNDQVNVKAFSGQAMACRKAMAGFSNCCVDSGWGNSAGLANCNSEEMAIGKAKAKKVTVSVGEACAHAVLGVCIQKKQVYCVFGGKLARIIQEQGRRDQLGIGFGSGDSPDCRGITVPELQGINFKLINFSDFYDDLMNNQKIPDSGTMVQQVKDRIAAQVNAQGGGK